MNTEKVNYTTTDELINVVTEQLKGYDCNTTINKSMVDSIINIFLNTVNQSLTEGNDVRLNHLGSFRPNFRPMHKIYNYKTKMYFTSPNQASVSFTPSSKLKGLLALT